MAEFLRSRRLRWAALTTVALATIGVACSETVAPRRAHDSDDGELAGAAISGSLIAQVSAITPTSVVTLSRSTTAISGAFTKNDVIWKTGAIAGAARSPLFTFTPAARVVWVPRSEGKGVVIRSFRSGDGHFHSLAVLADEAGKPPKRVYGFVDGRIQAIAGYTYRHVNGGWLRTAVRVTLFDHTGKATTQHDWRLEGGAISAISPVARVIQGVGENLRLVGLLAGRLVIPDALGAMQLDNGCAAEVAAVTAAGVAVGAASAALAAATADCLAGIHASCLLIPGLSAQLTAVAAAWTAAVDNLVECQNSLSPGSGGSGGGTDPGAGSYYPAIQLFIDTATGGGCDPSGDICVYYNY